MVAGFDVLAMGRVGVDIYPLQVGVGLEDVSTFGKFLGGSAANVAIAAARYGRRAALISKVGNDPFGRFVHKALVGFSVDDSFVGSVDDLPTPVTFCEIFPPDHFPLYFYRWPSAPDLRVVASELDFDAIRAADILWTTVTGLSQEPSRTATLEAMAARRHQHPTILDLDYRPMFWASRGEAHRRVGEALGVCTVALGNLDECETAVGTRDPDHAADELLAHGLKLAIVKQGPKGVLARTPTSEIRVPALQVDVVNGLGAGDAFGGAICHGLLSGWSLERLITFANAAGAIVAGRLECSDAMPTTGEVEAFMAGQEV